MSAYIKTIRIKSKKQRGFNLTTKIYRRIYVRIWTDKKFLELSDKAKLVWFYLLTGPHTTSLPGIFRETMPGMAAFLSWHNDVFQKAFMEIVGAGMVEADFKNHVVYVLNVIQYNPPQSVNVVKSWVMYFDLIPECDLKIKYLKDIYAYMEGLSDAFRDAFQLAFTDALTEASAIGIGLGIGQGSRTGKGARKPKVKPPNTYTDEFEKCWKVYPITEPLGRSNKSKAGKAFHARIQAKEATAGMMYKATLNYAQDITGKPDKTMGAQRFYGPDKEYEPYLWENYTPVKTAMEKDIDAVNEGIGHGE